MNLIDSYYKKTVTYKHSAQELRFKVSQDLFSSLDIDHGTQRLLRTLLFENISSYSKVLDLGCGYGPIGIAMKKVCPSAEVHMVDIDALALAFAHENMKLNELTDIQVYASLGYDQVKERDFDIIVSNIPAKVGDKALEHILKDAKNYLKAKGKVIVVVIDAIADFVGQQLKEDENIVITYHRSWPGHQVYHYQFLKNDSKSLVPSLAFERGVFFRGEQEFTSHQGRYTFDVSYNVAEFDRLSYASELLIQKIKGLSDLVKSAMCFQVGQGHVPYFVAKHFRLSQIKLIDRNLLALKTAQHNLDNYGVNAQLTHATFPQDGEQYDLVVSFIPEKEGHQMSMAFLTALSDSIKVGGKALLVSSSTDMSRIEELIARSFRIIDRNREKGNSVILLKK